MTTEREDVREKASPAEPCQIPSLRPTPTQTHTTMLTPAHHAAAVCEVFITFLRLGLTSFGGPIAHLGYFRATCVERLKWLDDARYGELVSLCQFLPGPASSQVGMALGLQRAGLWGALAAWIGFTAPSALALMWFASHLAAYHELAQSGWVQGLKIVAVAVVAQAVWGMARNLCRGFTRAALAVLAALVSMAWAGTPGQVLALLLCAAWGAAALRAPTDGLATLAEPEPEPGSHHAVAGGISARWGAAALLAFVLPLAALPVWAAMSGEPLAALLSSVYRAGALVFGGGHVVLPLLEAAVVSPGWVPEAQFLAGYGAAQAVPGPLFTFAAYLGALLPGVWQGAAGAALLLVTLFLPGFLVLIGALPFWERLRGRPTLRAAMAGLQAGVVGLLASALYDPVWTGAIHRPADAALALGALLLLAVARVPPVWVVGAAAFAGWIMAR